VSKHAEPMYIPSFMSPQCNCLQMSGLHTCAVSCGICWRCEAGCIWGVVLLTRTKLLHMEDFLDFVGFSAEHW